VARSDAHRPVLLEAVTELMAPRPGSTLVDATLGAGGHAERLLEALGPDGRLLGIDKDPAALRLATERLERFGDSFVPLAGDHTDLAGLLRAAGAFAVDGILFDLGVSSMQLDDPARGFSFREDGPLDMRMDPGAGESAAELVARLDAAQLQDLLRRFGEERRAAAIAREIVRRRESEPIVRTRQLAELVERVLGPAARRYKIHPATRTFQALRIAVNGEVQGLAALAETAVSLLRRSGRLVVIAYHSLEDRAIKHALRGLAHRCTCPPDLPVCGCGRENLVRVLTSRAWRPDAAEIDDNPRARSARLRAAERL
jgi:16S rRNA (cytosine1402-N4)-methyltransferase